jgi:hypothetical protein
VEAALRHYTRDGAYASFDEDVRGTLTAGKLADFVVLSKDILTEPAAEIVKTKVLLTVMGGKETYRSGEFDAIAVSGSGSGASDPQIALVELGKAIYPPLARQTRISGDVELTLDIAPDGSVRYVAESKGHPLLIQAALDSALHSRFSCNLCSQGTNAGKMIYTYQLHNVECCLSASVAPQDSSSLPVSGVKQSGNHVTVYDTPVCICDPAIEVGKKRSIRCLYLWNCGGS